MPRRVDAKPPGPTGYWEGDFALTVEERDRCREMLIRAHGAEPAVELVEALVRDLEATFETLLAYDSLPTPSQEVAGLRDVLKRYESLTEALRAGDRGAVERAARTFRRRLDPLTDARCFAILGRDVRIPPASLDQCERELRAVASRYAAIRRRPPELVPVDAAAGSLARKARKNDVKRSAARIATVLRRHGVPVTRTVLAANGKTIRAPFASAIVMYLRRARPGVPPTPVEEVRSYVNSLPPPARPHPRGRIVRLLSPRQSP